MGSVCGRFVIAGSKATSATTPEYEEYRDKVPQFIAARNSRMTEWVIENHLDIEVSQ